MPIKSYAKMVAFCTYSIFLKDGKTDNNWVVQSVMKPVDSESSKKKDTQEGGNKKNYNFDIEII